MKATWLICISLVTPSMVSAEQWQISLKEVSIHGRKANGRRWDAGSPPDPYGNFCVGVRKQDRCVCKKKAGISKHQDSFSFKSNLSIVFDKAEDDVLCVWVGLADRDMVNDDSIGSGFVDINLGENSFEVGRSTVLVFAESTGSEDDLVQSDFELPEPHNPRKDELYRITVSSAQIKPKRMDGSTWDAAKETSRGGEKFIGSLLRIGLKFVPGSQILSPLLGQQSQSARASHHSQTATAPDPRVKILTDKFVFLTPYTLNTYAPSWETKFLVTKDSIEGDAIKIELIDQDGTGKETIGSELVTSERLFSEEVLRLSFGSVEKLLIKVTRVLEKDAPLKASVKIDKGGSWKNTGLRVIGGQLVQAKSRGRYCINAKTCIGVNGNSKIRLPVDESKKTHVNIGQVIAVIGEKIYPIGSGASFISESTGEFLVGVASKSMASGSAEVDVSVFYPVEKVRTNE